MLEVSGGMGPENDHVGEQHVQDDLLDEVSLGFSVPSEQGLLKIPEETPVNPDGTSLGQQAVIEQLSLGVDPSPSLLMSGDQDMALPEDHLNGMVQHDASSGLEMLNEQPVMGDVAMETDEQQEVAMEVDSPPKAMPSGAESSNQGFDEVDETQSNNESSSQAPIEEAQSEITEDAGRGSAEIATTTVEAGTPIENAEVVTEDTTAGTEDAEAVSVDAEAVTQDAAPETVDAAAVSEDAEPRIENTVSTEETAAGTEPTDNIIHVLDLDPINVDPSEESEETSGNVEAREVVADAGDAESVALIKGPEEPKEDVTAPSLPIGTTADGAPLVR